jgi:hypothetical protein
VVLHGVRLNVDALVDFLAMHGHLFGRTDAKADLSALHPNHRDGDVLADHYSLANATRENEHGNQQAGQAPKRLSRLFTWISPFEFQ